MHSLNTIDVDNRADTSLATADANLRGDVVSKLIADAFEAAQASDKSVMLDHLLDSLGVLSLATIANGVFLNHRFGGASTASWLAPRKSDPVEAREIRDLAQRVQQIDGDAIDAMVEVFNAPPLSTTSPVGAMLANLPLRRTRRLHAD